MGFGGWRLAVLRLRSLLGSLGRGVAPVGSLILGTLRGSRPTVRGLRERNGRRASAKRGQHGTLSRVPGRLRGSDQLPRRRHAGGRRTRTGRPRRRPRGGQGLRRGGRANRARGASRRQRSLRAPSRSHRGERRCRRGFDGLASPHLPMLVPRSRAVPPPLVHTKARPAVTERAETFVGLPRSRDRRAFPRRRARGRRRKRHRRI